MIEQIAKHHDQLENIKKIVNSKVHVTETSSVFFNLSNCTIKVGLYKSRFLENTITRHLFKRQVAFFGLR